MFTIVGEQRHDRHRPRLVASAEATAAIDNPGQVVREFYVIWTVDKG